MPIYKVAVKFVDPQNDVEVRTVEFDADKPSAAEDAVLQADSKYGVPCVRLIDATAGSEKEFIIPAENIIAIEVTRKQDPKPAGDSTPRAFPSPMVKSGPRGSRR